MIGNFVSPFPLITFNAATIDAVTWKVLNPLGLPHPCSMLRLVNQSGALFYLGFGEKIQEVVVVPRGTFEFNFQLNNQPNGATCLLRKGTKFYIRGIAAAGNVYLTGFHQE